MLATLAPLAKSALKWVLLAIVIVGLFFGLKYYRNQVVLLRGEVKTQAATITGLQDQYAKYQEALNEQAQNVQVRERTRTVIRRVIEKTPATSACASSPAVAAALDGLRTTPANSKSGSP